MCRDGRLKVGDRILEIDGSDATKLCLSKAYDALASSSASVTLLVEYNVSVIGQLLSGIHYPQSKQVKREFIERVTLKLTANALVALVEAEQDCFKELFEAVDITRRISEFIWLQ